MGSSVSCVAKENLAVHDDALSDALTPIGSPECLSGAASQETSLLRRPSCGDNTAMALWANGLPQERSEPGMLSRGLSMRHSRSSSSVGDWEDMDDSGDANGHIDEEDLMDLPFPLRSHPEPEHTSTTNDSSSVLNGSQFASLMGLIQDGENNSGAAGDQRIAFQRIVVDGAKVHHQPPVEEQHERATEQNAVPARNTIDVTRPCPQHLFVRNQLKTKNDDPSHQE